MKTRRCLRVLIAIVTALAIAPNAESQCPGECAAQLLTMGGTSACGSVIVIPNNSSSGACKPTTCGTKENCEFSVDVFATANTGCYLIWKHEICKVDTSGVPFGDCAVATATITSDFTQYLVGFPVVCGREESFYLIDPIDQAITGGASMTCTACN